MMKRATKSRKSKIGRKTTLRIFVDSPALTLGFDPTDANVVAAGTRGRFIAKGSRTLDLRVVGMIVGVRGRIELQLQTSDPTLVAILKHIRRDPTRPKGLTDDDIASKMSDLDVEGR